MKITQGVSAARYALRSIASGISVADEGGFYGPGLTVEEILQLIGEGLAPNSFLTVIRGGQGTVNAIGTLGATPVVDLALGNYHWGTLDQNATVTFTGWTSGKDCQITVEVVENATGGWTPTFSGVTWIGGDVPTHTTTALTVTHYVFFSRDGGTTIYGAQVGSGGGALSADQAYMPLTTVVDGEPVLVWDANNSLIPTLVPLE